MCLHVCLCVRSINISSLPSSRCLYDTAALLSSCLSLYLPDCFIEVHSDTIYAGKQEERMYSQTATEDIPLSPCLFLHQQFGH